MMEPIEHIFSDFKGNHLLVALDFFDNHYKQHSLCIPEEYADIDIIDISIRKVFPEMPIHYSVFFLMTSWLIEQFTRFDKAIFTYVCSVDNLDTKHPDIPPQEYRRDLFNALYQRVSRTLNLKVQDIEYGPEGYVTYGRAFYRIAHAPIIHLIVSNIEDKTY